MDSVRAAGALGTGKTLLSFLTKVGVPWLPNPYFIKLWPCAVSKAFASEVGAPR